MNASELYLCHHCDCLHELSNLKIGFSASCSQCGASIRAKKSADQSSAIALVLAAIPMFLIANVFPLITLDLAGYSQQGLLITGVIQLWASGLWPLSMLVFFTTILLPGLYLLGLLYVLVPLQSGRAAPKAGVVFRWVNHVEVWNMLEIYLLGILVALTKLGTIASLVIGPALYAFVALIIINAINGSRLDKHAVWDRMPSNMLATDQ